MSTWKNKAVLNDFSDSKNMANIEACYFIKHKHLISEECGRIDPV